MKHANIVKIAIVKSALIRIVAIILKQRWLWSGHDYGRKKAKFMEIILSNKLYALGLGIAWVGNVYECYYGTAQPGIRSIFIRAVGTCFLLH